MPVAKPRAPLRADPSQLVLAEATSFARRYTYPIAEPLSQVLRPDFFHPVRDRLAAGDTIRIVETDAARQIVRRYVDVLVISSGQSPAGLLLHVETGIVEPSVSETAPPEPDGRRQRRKQRQNHPQKQERNSHGDDCRHL